MKRTIVALILLLLSSGSIYFIYEKGFFSSKVETTEDIKDNRVCTVLVQEKEMGLTFPLVAGVSARKSVLITSEVTARISKIYVKPAGYVKAGELLMELEDEREKAMLKEAEISLAEDKRRLRASSTLAVKGVVSRDSLAKLESQVKQQEAIVEARTAELAERRILAPFSGVVSLHQMAEGLLVKPGNPLLQLDDIGEVYADFALPERFLSKIVVGQEVTASTEAWPGQVFSGKIREIDTHVNSNTLAVMVRIYFKNNDQHLLDGMMLSLNLNLAAEKKPVIPLRAVMFIGDEKYVYVLNSDLTVSRRKVVFGAIHDTDVAIKEGIRVGMRIVSEGNERLHDGDKVVLLDNNSENDDISGGMKLKRRSDTGDKIL